MAENGNVDERIQRLVERHEALAQSLELLTADVQSLAGTVQKHDVYLERNDQYLNTLMEATSQLLQVAKIHEQRLTRLEGQEGA